MTDHDIQQKAVQTILKLKTDTLRAGRKDALPVVDRLLAAIKAYPAYQLAEVACADVGRGTELPAAVIRSLAEG